MCRDKCNKCNECNPCDNGCQKVECGCKFEVDAACVRYTKNNLSCTGHPRGALLEDILESIDKRLCEEGEQLDNVVVEAGDNVTVDIEQSGDTTVYTVNSIPPEPKEYFYEENVEEISILDFYPPDYSGEWIMPSNYNVLEYENTRATSMMVEVHVSYEEIINATHLEGAYNTVVSGIIKTDNASLQIPEYIKEGMIGLDIVLYNRATGQPATNNGDELILTPSGDIADVHLQPSVMTPNTSYFKVLQLLPGEKVALMFMSKSLNAVQNLSQAQILVKEL